MEFCWVHDGILVKDINSKDFNLKLITNRIIKNKKARKVLVVLIAIALVTLNTQVAYATDFTKLDAFGNKLLKMAQSFGRWVFLVMGIVSVIKDVMEGGNKDSILKTIVKYLIAFACLFALPFLFDLIEEAF